VEDYFICLGVTLQIIYIWHKILYFVHQDIIYFFVLYPKVSHSNRRAAVVEPLTQQLITNSIVHSLDVAESLAQSMGPVVSPQVNLPAPVFDHLVGVADGQGSISFLAFEKEVLRFGRGLGQIRLQGFVRGLVYDQDVCLAGFLLPDPDGVSWFYTLHVLYFKLQKIADPEPVVYAHGEQEVVSGVSR